VSALDDALRGRLDHVRERIARAARRVGRDPGAVRLVAVSKTYSIDHVLAAARAGQTDFGENRVQEGLQKIAQSADTTIRWHVIGHLQSNKARKAAEAFDWIQSIDSLDLLRKVDEAAAAAGRRPKVLVQVDLAGEATKFGAPPEQVPAMFEAELKAVDLVGLMLLPPAAEDPDEARPWFRRLVAFRNGLAAAGVPAGRLAELSMGMSHDFEVAIEEGATIVRIGSAIFGERH
jgi:pyridoxal phosphate enzyme (YggS family)